MTESLTLSAIAALEQLEQSASQGTWTATNAAAAPCEAWGIDGVIEHDFVSKRDAEFIAAFRNDARALLALARRALTGDSQDTLSGDCSGCGRQLYAEYWTLPRPGRFCHTCYREEKTR